MVFIKFGVLLSSKVAGLAFPRTVQAGDTVLGDLGVRVVMPIWIRHKVKSKERTGTGLGPRGSTSGESVEEEKLMQETQSSVVGMEEGRRMDVK